MSVSKRKGEYWGAAIIVSLFAGAVVCGSIGWRQYIGDSMPLTWTDVAYRLLAIFTVNANFDEPNVPPLLDIARFLAPLALAGTFVLVTIAYFRKKLLAFAVKRLYRGHAIFFGCNPRSLLLASDLAKTRRVVFIPADENDRDDDLGRVSGIGAVALSGADSGKAALRRAALERAEALFIMTGSDAATQSASRAAAEILGTETPLARRARKARRTRPSVFAEYSDDFALRLAREQEETRSTGTVPSAAYVLARSFNLELLLAREVIDRCQPNDLSMDRPFHAAIFGFDKLGQALAFEAAQMFHFPDLKRPRLTVVDRGVESKSAEFLLRHPGFASVADIRAVEAREWVRSLEGDLPTVALVSFPDFALSFDTARILRQLSLAAPPSDPDRTPTPLRILVVPPVDATESFPGPECSADFLAVNGIEAVDTDAILNGSDVMNRADRNDAVAKGIHYSWMATAGDAWESARIDAEWAGLSDTLRDSNRYASRHLFVKLAYLGWKALPVGAAAPDVGAAGGTAGNGAPVNGAAVVGTTADTFDFSKIDEGQLEVISRLEHNRWVAEKYLAGYMPTSCEDPEAYRIRKRDNRLHRDLVPWEGLSRETRRKDANALRFSNEIMASAGLVLVPIVDDASKP